MYAEDDLLPLSGLQHLTYCARRAALVHVERLWAENVYTAEGRHLHERVDETGPPREAFGGVRVVRRMPLRSLALGLSGTADVVEFHPSAADGGPQVPLPVEYKRGQRRQEEAFEVQLCAQALCLEEMLGASVPEGAVYFGLTRRRLPVLFDDALRARTRAAARRLHAIVASGVTPPFELGPKCDKCSLAGPCGIRIARARQSAGRYLDALLIGDDP